MLHQRFPEIPRIALTATADARTREEIIERLGLGQAANSLPRFDRPNIRYRIAPKRNAKHQLLHFLRAEHAWRRRHRLLLVAQENGGDGRVR